MLWFDFVAIFVVPDIGLVSMRLVEPADHLSNHTIIPDIQVHVFPYGTGPVNILLQGSTLHVDSDIGDVAGSSISLQPDVLELRWFAFVALFYHRSVSAPDSQEECVIIIVVVRPSSCNNTDIEDNAVGALENGFVVEVFFAYLKLDVGRILEVYDLPSLSILDVICDSKCIIEIPVASEPVYVVPNIRGGYIVFVETTVVRQSKLLVGQGHNK